MGRDETKPSSKWNRILLSLFTVLKVSPDSRVRTRIESIESQRSIHLFEAASEKKRMVHVAVEEAVAFYEVWAFEIES